MNQLSFISNQWTPVKITKKKTNVSRKKNLIVNGIEKKISSLNKQKSIKLSKSLNDNVTTFKEAKTTINWRKMLMDARIFKKLNQRQLAQKLNCSATDVQKWENGKSVPDGSMRVKLNQILKVKLPKINKPKNKDGE